MAYPETITYYPSGGYPSNDVQEWYFFPTTKGNKVIFTMDSIDTEDGFDKITVSEFAVPEDINNADPILQTYQGSSVGTPVESSIGFRVRFTSDVSVEATGFQFTVSETTGGDMPLTSLDYPAGSGNYPSNAREIWYFEDGLINFTAFRTEAGYDYLKVYEVNGNVAPTLLGSYDGTSIPADISNTKRLLFYFISDTSVEDTGFVLSFTPNAGGDESLEVNNALHGHTANNVVLTVNNALAINNALHGHTAGNVALQVNAPLQVDSALHQQTANNIALIVNHNLEVANGVHGLASDSIEVAVNYSLAIGNALHAHTANNIVLDSGITLEVANGIHGHTADGISLTVNYNLEVANAVHNHSADAISVAVNHDLSIDNCLHLHTANNIDLASGNDLIIANGVHGHTAYTIALSVNYNLQVASCTHGHTANNLALTANYQLIVANCYHGHRADTLYFGIQDMEVLQMQSQITTQLQLQSEVSILVSEVSQLTTQLQLQSLVTTQVNRNSQITTQLQKTSKIK